MSVIEIPKRRAQLRLVKPGDENGASVIDHPRVGSTRVEITARSPEEQAAWNADVIMACVHSEIEMLMLKARQIAQQHGRERQAIAMFETAASKIRHALS